VRSRLESTPRKARGVLHSHCNQPLRRSSNLPETHVRTLVGYTGIGLWSRRSRVRAPSVTQVRSSAPITYLRMLLLSASSMLLR
jgi:hypothetical protein